MNINLCKSELDLLSSSQLSLFTFLNCCRTKSGSELLKSWIESPLASIPLINDRLDMVEYFGNDNLLRMDLFNTLRTLPPVTPSLKHFSGTSTKPARLKDCVSLSEFSNSVLNIPKKLKGAKYFSTEFNQFEENLEKLVELIKMSIETKEISGFEYEYRVKPSFEPKLGHINERIKKIEAEIDNLRVAATKSLGVSKELQLVTMQNELAFEGSKSEIHDGMRASCGMSFIIVSHLQKNVKITCPELKSLSKQKNEAVEEYLTAQIEVEQRIIEITKGYVEFIQSVQELCSYLDCILSIAHACFSAAGRYCRPILNNSGVIELNNFRHPSAEQLGLFIPNSISMQKGKSSFFLMTGPNMGGKSTFLKQTGLCVIMAHIGSFVPADFANICLVDRVMARIGAGDSQLLGQSTFMCEMSELAEVLQCATENSLILIDEIGRGTSTSEGLGIAWGTCEYLSELGCFTLFATHFSELVTMELKNFEVFQMEVKVSAGIEFTHRVIAGGMQASFGIEIAEMFGVAEVIIEDARFIKKTAEDLERKG